ncbi:MAG TPA: hypothetical protein VFT65_18405 [Candidatus Angelobacter sp.]|nr:hypothetical protein [Candidatus Angelobacter sp.]
MKKLIASGAVVGCLLFGVQAVVAQTADVHGKAASSAQSKSGAKAEANRSVSADPWVGSWKMDVSRSRLHGPAPQEETLVIESVAGGDIKYSLKSVGQDSQYTITYDGKSDSAAPVLVDGKEAGTATYHRVNSRQYSGKSKMSSGLTTTETIELSPNHKQLTVTVHARQAEGEYDETAVYTR